MREAAAPVDNRIKLVKVKKILKKSKDITFDIQVEDEHEFFANGFCVKNCIGKFHPHGDNGTYSALVNMVNCAEPLINGQGNFGDYNEGAAAYRYTECKPTPYADNILLDPIYLDVIPYVSNYDGNFKEPVYLPSKLPNLLINGTYGIATGCSVGIPSFTKESVIKLLIKALKNKKITAKVLAETLEFKFTYGGEYAGDGSELISYFKTGEGSLLFMPEVEVIRDGRIVMKSLSPRFNVEKTLEKISELKGVKDVSDNIDGSKLEFEILLSDRSKDLIKKIYSLLTTSLPCSTIITIRHNDGEKVSFKKLNLIEYVQMWIDYRIDLEKKVVNRLIDLSNDKLRYYKWLLFAVLNRKEIIQALDKDDPKKHLIKKFKISEEQADFILDLKVRMLARIEEKTINRKILQYKKEIKFLTKELKNVNNRIIKQLSNKK